MTMAQVIDGLAVIGAATCLYWAVRLLTLFLGWVERSEIERQAREGAGLPRGVKPLAMAATVGIGATTGDAIPPEHVAAIAAVVAMLGAHRVVMIEDSAGGHAWTSAGRWMHQTSHRTH